MYQVIVVGAGPAGAYLAYLMAKHGVDVLLLEKETLPRYKACGGGLTGKALRELEIDVSSQVKGIGYSATFTHKLQNPVVMTNNQPIAHLVDRKQFDAFLVNKAREVGVTVIENAFVRDYETDSTGVVVRTDNEEWYGQYLVGADGAYSKVARKMGFKPDGIALTLEADLPNELMESSKHIREGELLVDYGIVPNGYAWAFPNRDVVAIGIGDFTGRVTGMRLRSLLGEWMNYLGVEPDAWHSYVRGWIIPYKSRVSVLHGKREILIGDAAGLTDAFIGEGLYAAFLSARVAAEVLTNIVTDVECNLADYTDQVTRVLGEHVANAYRLNRLFYPLSGLAHGIIRKHPEWHDIVPQIASGALSYAELIKIGAEKLHIPFVGNLVSRA